MVFASIAATGTVMNAGEHVWAAVQHSQLQYQIGAGGAGDANGLVEGMAAAGADGAGAGGAAAGVAAGAGAGAATATGAGAAAGAGAAGEETSSGENPYTPTSNPIPQTVYPKPCTLIKES